MYRPVDPMETNTEKTLTHDLWIDVSARRCDLFDGRAYELGNDQRIDRFFRALGSDLRAAQA